MNEPYEREETDENPADFWNQVGVYVRNAVNDLLEEAAAPEEELTLEREGGDPVDVYVPAGVMTVDQITDLMYNFESQNINCEFHIRFQSN